MKLEEAIKAMKEGKKCEWIIKTDLNPDEKNPLIGYDVKKTVSGFYDWNEDDADDILLSALLKGDTNWEIYRETLSDKIFYSHTGIDDKEHIYYDSEKGNKLKTDDVKEFIQQLKKELIKQTESKDGYKLYYEAVILTIDKLIGDKLK